MFGASAYPSEEDHGLEVKKQDELSAMERFVLAPLESGRICAVNAPLAFRKFMEGKVF